MAIKTSIAMACHTDFYGVFSTVQALRMYQDLTDCEIIVLDNDGNGIHGRDTRQFIENIQGTGVPISYHTLEGDTGTSRTRHHLFELAQGELVVVMDCHVMLQANALSKLKAFWAKADDQMKKNMFTGPLLMDTLNYRQTHFECEWRGEMWGTWANAWKKDGKYYVARSSPDGTKIQLKQIMTDKFELEFSHGWPGHEAALRKLGFTEAGVADDDIFEVPAQGLGLFLVAKEHWLGFNPHHKHFGGEECYIHEKYRMAGRKTLCLPFMGWNHRFGRPEGPRYPITTVGKMRNYVLEFMELGLDLEPIRKHFIDEIKVKPEEWDKCLADPINYDPYSNWAPNTAPSNMKPVMLSNLGMKLPMVATNLNGMAVEVAGEPRDAEVHFAKYVELGTKCNSIVELNKRRETTLFWAAGLDRFKCSGSCQNGGSCDCKSPSTLVSYHGEQDTLLEMIGEKVAEGKGRLTEYINIPRQVSDPIPDLDRDFDLLYINDDNSYSRITEILDKLGPRIKKYIVLRGAIAGHAGITGEDGQKPGMFFAVRMFIKKNPNWFISYHSQDQYGFTVLTCVEDERPEMPIIIWPRSDDEGKPCGPGSELRDILKSLGIESTPTCSCNAFAAKMDAIGPDGCEAIMDEILDWLSDQAKARGLEKFFFRPAVKIAVKQAIKRARKKLANGKCS